MNRARQQQQGADANAHANATRCNAQRDEPSPYRCNCKDTSATHIERGLRTSQSPQVSSRPSPAGRGGHRSPARRPHPCRANRAGMQLCHGRTAARHAAVGCPAGTPTRTQRSCAPPSASTTSAPLLGTFVELESCSRPSSLAAGSSRRWCALLDSRLPIPSFRPCVLIFLSSRRHTATLPHCHTVTFPHFHISTLPHCHIATLPHCHIATLPTLALPHGHHTQVTANVLIKTYRTGRNPEGAEAVLREFPAWGLSPDACTFSTLVDSYGLAGRIDDAQRVASMAEAMGVADSCVSRPPLPPCAPSLSPPFRSPQTARAPPASASQPGLLGARAFRPAH